MSKTYNLADVREISKEFLDLFSIITELKEGDKLILENSKLFLDTSNSYAQPFYRWWNNQNKENITTFIEVQIETYIAFIDFITAAISNISMQTFEKLQLMEIQGIHRDFRDKLLTGLNNLFLTYKNSASVSERLEKLYQNIKK
jgi:hypothetical protein